MHDLNLTLFYKTSMDIELSGSEGDALWSLVCDIRKWMTNKWSSRGIDIPGDVAIWSSFKTGCRFSDPSRVVQFTSAIYYADDGRHQWACSIIENITERGYAARKWVTEIGFSCESSLKGTVSLVLSYGDQPGFLGPCQDEPAPSIPGIVRLLLSDARLKCSVSGVDLSANAKELKAGMFPMFWALLSDPMRETPVIFISPKVSEGKVELLVDPQMLTDAVGPSALVYYTNSVEFIEEMSATIPERSYRCTNGTVRVYAGRLRVDDPKDQYRHRFFTAEAIEKMGADALVTVFRRAYAQDVHFYERMVRIDVVRDMIYRSSLEKRAKRQLEQTEELVLEIAEGELLKRSGEVDALRDENDQLKGEIFNLESKVGAYEAVFDNNSPDGVESKELWRWPQKPCEVVELFRRIGDDKIVFTSRAIRSLDDCRSSEGTIWDALRDLRLIAYELLSSDDRVDIVREFNSRSRFEYAHGSGMMTRKDNALMRQYFDEYDGRKISVEAHIKSGSKETDPKFIRVYFAYDAPTRRIVVSHIGSHLDTYSTRFRH